MKKLVLISLVLLGLIFFRFFMFEKSPIAPNIIGIGHLQHEAKNGTWFVVIDSNQYTISEVSVFDHYLDISFKTQKFVEGTPVTVFTSTHKEGVSAVYGVQSAQQIKEFYHKNFIDFLIRFAGIIVSAIWIMYMTRLLDDESFRKC